MKNLRMVSGLAMFGVLSTSFHFAEILALDKAILFPSANRMSLQSTAGGDDVSLKMKHVSGKWRAILKL